MMSVVNAENGRPFRTKKEHGLAGGHVDFVETSMFGPEFKGAGTYTIVGPSPYERKWFGQITVDADGRVLKVS
jgi:hypothetical protein